MGSTSFLECELVTRVPPSKKDREVLPGARQRECLVLNPDVAPGLGQSAVNTADGMGTKHYKAD